MEATRASPEIVGREQELETLSGFLSDATSSRALALTGAAGIGKTTLWEAGVATAWSNGLRVLSARPSEAETEFAFAALADLMEDVDTGSVPRLPEPQRQALDVALLRSEPAGPPPGTFAISAGFLSTLRALSHEQPVLVAIDDFQALDRPSAGVLAFAARRVRGQRIRFLLASRAEGLSRLERTFAVIGLETLEVGSLSYGAARALLSRRLDLTLSRPVLRKIVDAADGNPLFILEVSRSVAAHGTLELGSDLPTPREVEDVFGERVANASPRSRKLMLSVVLAGGLSRSELASIVGARTIEEGIRNGLLNVDGDRVRISHPLLAAAVRAHSSARARRSLHSRLAQVFDDEARRARHVALATVTPDAELAAELAAAAQHAMARGAADDAVELAEHTLRLTPVRNSEYTERLLGLAEYLEVTGDQARIEELLEHEVDSLPPGSSRARAHLLLAGMSGDASDELHLERAFAECGDDPALRATALEKRAILVSGIRAERFHDAETWLDDAVPSARRAGEDTERLVVHTLAWIRTLRGRPIDDLIQRLERLARSPLDASGIKHLVVQRLTFDGDVDQARPLFRELMALADERGEARFVRLHIQLCGLELRAGDTRAASRLLAESYEWDDSKHADAARARYNALLAAAHGLPDETEKWASTAIESGLSSGHAWGRLEGQRALGLAALLQSEPGRAVECLRAVWDHALREGVENPGVFPVAPDLVEALVDRGEVEEAQAVTERLMWLATAQEHHWGLASGKRCQALLAFGTAGYDARAAATLDDAAAAYGALGLRFDRARSLLLLGRAHRRARKWSAARASLERAAAAFEELGSTGWERLARDEVDRVGGRRPGVRGSLTPTERRVAELAAEGLSNKEIASMLFVSVHTVEVHLSHAYAKLGVRSRTQLARAIAANQ